MCFLGNRRVSQLPVAAANGGYIGHTLQTQTGDKG